MANINGIQRNNFSYAFAWMLYYAWLVSFATWYKTSPFIDRIFADQYITTIHFINLIFTGIFVFIKKKEWFVKYAQIGSIIIVSAVGLFLTVPYPSFKITIAVIIGIAIGCVNISVLIPFVFVLNNTEKLYSIVLSNLLINFLSLFQHWNIIDKSSINFNIFPMVILIIALSTTAFFKKSSIQTKTDEINEEKQKLEPRIYLTVLFNCAFVIIYYGVAKSVIMNTAANYGQEVLIWYYVSGLIGCIFYFALYAYSRNAFIWMINFSFAFVAMGLLCNTVVEQIPSMAVAFAVCLGIGGTIGKINIYYIIGVVGKKYNSMKYIIISTIFIGLCGGVTGIIIANTLNNSNVFEISIIACLISIIFIIVFMIFSPIIVLENYYSDIADDSAKSEIENEQTDVFENYQLSKREVEVCELLLRGKTMRQIASNLSLAYSTVNTYCTSLYRKLDINSRAELLIMFNEYLVK